MSIRYKQNIMEALKQKGYTSTRLRKEKIFGESAMSEFRSGGEIKHKTLDTLCRLLDCKIEDVIEYIPDTPTDKP